MGRRMRWFLNVTYWETENGSEYFSFSFHREDPFTIKMYGAVGFQFLDK